MVDYLNKYGYTPDREAIGRALDIIAANLENVASEQVYKEAGAESIEKAYASPFTLTARPAK